MKKGKDPTRDTSKKMSHHKGGGRGSEDLRGSDTANGHDPHFPGGTPYRPGVHLGTENKSPTSGGGR